MSGSCMRSIAETLPHLTMVPDLRMAMKVGADSVSNEIWTHLEAIGMRYFTASSTQTY